METITISSETDFIKIKINRALGFPNKTCHWGGYEVECDLEIYSDGFAVKSNLYTSTGEFYNLFITLKKCYEDLKGEAHYISFEGNLRINFLFDKLGHITVKGEFSKQFIHDNNLRFEFVTDQTFLSSTISDLELLYEKYGDDYGVKNRTSSN